MQANVTPIPSSFVANDQQISITSVLSKTFSAWCLFVLDNLWNAVVCFQPPSLLIGKVWVPVMHFCVSHALQSALKCGQEARITWFILVQPLIRSTVRAFSISSALWVLEVVCCFYHSFYQIDHCTVWWILVGVNWLMSCQECRRAVFLANCCTSCTPQSFFSILQNQLIGYADDFIKVSEWCDLWGMKLNMGQSLH